MSWRDLLSELESVEAELLRDLEAVRLVKDMVARYENLPETAQPSPPHHRAKLTPDAVVTIRARADAGVSFSRLGRENGVSSTTIMQIVNRATWRHV